jgi:hypothetical protein
MNAFPVLEEYTKFNEATGQYEDYYAPHGGMTLRDYFAAKAMQSRLLITGDWGFERIANDSYLIADAMLKAREGQ